MFTNSIRRIFAAVMIFAVQMWSTPATPIAQGQRPVRVDARAWNAAASGRADVLVQAVRFATVKP